jgi:hypothetical protein
MLHLKPVDGVVSNRQSVERFLRVARSFGTHTAESIINQSVRTKSLNNLPNTKQTHTIDAEHL